MSATFFIYARHGLTGEEKRLIYTPAISELLDESTGEPVPLPDLGKAQTHPINKVSKVNPGRKDKDNLKTIKIQAGLKCNYSCSYCLQATHNQESVKQKDYRSILESIKAILKPDTEVKFEFWGGEPLLYWKTILPLAEELRALYPNCKFSMITNGSLLSADKNERLIELGFTVSVSHDGPGHHVRGEDPLQIPEKREAIMALYNVLAPLGRMSFNPTINSQNPSHKANVEWFKANVDEHVALGEGELVTIYDDSTLDLCFPDDATNAQYRKDKLAFLNSDDATRFSTVIMKLKGFISGLVNRRNYMDIGQKCGMDRPDYVAMNMGGQVLTCQNVSSGVKAPNGESHVIGSIDDLDSVAMTTATHWSNRSNCSKCPVVQLCAGSCMFLDEGTDHWRASCNNSYTDNVVMLAAAIDMLTGFLPYRIEGADVDMPPGREYIWEPTNTVVKKRKTIPIIAG